MNHVDAGHRFEQFARDVNRRAGAAGGEGHLALFLAERDEFFQVFGWYVVVDHQHVRRRRQERDGREILHHVIRHFGIQRAVDRVRANGADHDGVAVRRRFGHEISA